MINIREKRICIKPNCNTMALYNYNDKKKGKYCKSHMEKNMVDVTRRKTNICTYPKCKIRSSYGYEKK